VDFGVSGGGALRVFGRHGQVGGQQVGNGTGRERGATAARPRACVARPCPGLTPPFNQSPSSSVSSCPAGLVEANGYCAAGPTCTGATYASGTSCLACPTGCSACSSSTQCSACLVGYQASGSTCGACAGRGGGRRLRVYRPRRDWTAEMGPPLMVPWLAASLLGPPARLCCCMPFCVLPDAWATPTGLMLPPQ
jgi:hypothetical protein